MRKTVITYGTRYWAHGDEPFGFTRHRTVYPFWIWLVHTIAAYHPHWGWWEKMWLSLLPDIGDPICYWYCVKLSTAYEERRIEEASQPIAWEDIPTKERDSIRSMLYEDMRMNEEEGWEYPPLIQQMLRTKQI